MFTPLCTDSSDDFLSSGQKRARMVTPAEGNPYWFPWTDKAACILDLFRHLPRSIFSDAQMEVVNWALDAFGISNVPSVDVMKNVDDYLQSLCGIHTNHYEHLQNRTGICSQPLAEYPGFADEGALGHIYYMNDFAGIIHQEMANPNVRPHIHHYHEDSGKRLEHAWQAQAWRDLDPELATPMVRIGRQDFYTYEITQLDSGQLVVPHCWFTRSRNMGSEDLYGMGWKVEIDHHGYGYVVSEWEQVEFSAKSLLVSFPRLVEQYEEDELYDPRHILAGLPHQQVHQQSNIHFISTSNLAPPLEMLDGVVQQLDVSQRDGIWAWDIEAKEMVLMIPAVLAMLGDNPMQSEFACHIGLAGKYFCRSCWVKGHDAEDEGPLPARTTTTESGSVHSNASSGKSVSKKRRRCQETLSELRDWAKRFLTKNNLRYKEESINKLKSIFSTSATINCKTEAAKIMTQSGMKDTFLEHFRQKVFTFISKLPTGTTREEKQEKVNEFVEKELPDSIYSPLSYAGLDPHRDTPVEILHVILLGFVKYYWHDTLARLSDADKTKLTHRLSSLDLSALGISTLSGETFWHHSKPCYEAWIALSALVPLVWQPVIENLDSYLVILEQAIDRFLHAAAARTPRWFNKPKFHIIKHLPWHIRHFGPAILYAAEGFESFNAVIRDYSVHSNRQAPSRDIAWGFARCNRNRHLLSKGVFLRPDLMDRQVPVEYFSDNIEDWITAQPGPFALIRPRATGKNPIADAFGLNQSFTEVSGPPGRCIKFPNCFGSADPSAEQFNLFTSAVSVNLEKYSIDDFVLVSGEHSNHLSKPIVARVVEIVQIVGAGGLDNLANVDLIDAYDATSISRNYGVPSLTISVSLLVPPTEILSQVNVQHNCARNSCDLSNSRVVREERENTEKTLPRTRHYNLSDLLLNTNQMHSGIYLQRLHPSIPPLDQEQVILTGATRELEEQKAAKVVQKSRTKKPVNTSSSGNQLVPATITACSGLPSNGCVTIPVVSDVCTDLTGGLNFLNQEISAVVVPDGFVCSFYE
ncbi:hypothetical protein EV359DRAFT_86638 [Lentinula novae-zelandiae]|nr:hypothetical protein EV359DRAFT_86638 [Lentinula novae-zelandiae]